MVTTRVTATIAVLTTLGMAPGAPEAAGDETTAVVEPKEIDDLLANPGMGWQTFHRFADKDEHLAGLPSSSAYFRFYWSELEPAEGRIDFAKLDGLLERARKAGQKLAFRVMCAGTSNREMYVPAWLREKGCPGFEYRYGGKGRSYWVPDMDHALFRDAHFRLIENLGKRYDGHADVDLLDIGTVGLWGEWHMSQTGVDMPSPETRREIIDAWCRAFPKTPKVMLIGDAAGMRQAIASGCGWRADCLGDLGGFSESWNHMDDFYRQQIEKTDAGDAWKKAPIAFESCWDMRKWVREGWDVPSIFDYALSLHASYLNNKSAPLPESSRDEVERFLRRLGYRLVLRRLEHPRKIVPGSRVTVDMVWDNVGVAPPYRDACLAFRLTRKGKRPCVLASDKSIRGWLPGRREVPVELEIPEDVRRVEHQLELAILDPVTGKPAIRLAISGRSDEGWYSLGEVDVTGQ
jgi:hypothetical protein